MGFCEIVILEVAVVEAAIGFICEHALLEKFVEPLIPVVGMAAKIAFDTAIETSVELITEKAVEGLIEWGTQVFNPALPSSEN
ncbi:MAG: hypothetical protein IGS39_02355 [Calothrix sp. C42_A2020_038]|nr:hypothetical protein [Calothrix sp. C42_A2020_038]